MNGKKARQLRKKAKHLLIDWIRSMTPEGEDSKKINPKTLNFSTAPILNVWKYTYVRHPLQNWHFASDILHQIGIIISLKTSFTKWEFRLRRLSQHEHFA